MKNVKSSITILDILLIVLIALKVAGVSNLNWWWTLSPLWIPLVLLVGLVLFGILLAPFTKNDDD